MLFFGLGSAGPLIALVADIPRSDDARGGIAFSRPAQMARRSGRHPDRQRIAFCLIWIMRWKCAVATSVCLTCRRRPSRPVSAGEIAAQTDRLARKTYGLE